MITFTIPGDMRGKGRPRFTARGGFARAYTDTKTENMEAWVKLCALERHPGMRPLDGPVALSMTINVAVPASWPKKRRAHALDGTLRPIGKPDVDNCCKLVADALNGIAWRDDSQIVALTVHKRYAEVAETVLTVTEV